MTKERFISQNKYDWSVYQGMLNGWEMYSPNELGQAYLRVCSDLAYAQGHFPDTEVCRSLNALALQFHHILYRRQPQRWKELLFFFRYTVPMSFYRSRRFLIFALVLYLIGTMIGMVSQFVNSDFFGDFMGGSYEDITRQNIASGNPMGIYGMEEETEMFFSITLNNIWVGFVYFIYGLLTPFFSIYMTVMTGTMMGCFDAFFMQQGLALDVFIAPNEHGALELPAAIVCSAAGIQLGMGWFFPGKQTRMRALMASAQESMCMVLAMVPFFIVAGFIESFVTRHQEWPLYVRAAIVTCGLALSVYYMVILPMQIKKNRG